MLIGTWIQDAKAKASNEDDEKLFEINARA